MTGLELVEYDIIRECREFLVQSYLYMKSTDSAFQSASENGLTLSRSFILDIAEPSSHDTRGCVANEWMGYEVLSGNLSWST
jgi:hypothetical protein